MKPSPRHPTRRRCFVHGRTGNLLNIAPAEIGNYPLKGYKPITEAAYWRLYRKYEREARAMGKQVEMAVQING